MGAVQVAGFEVCAHVLTLLVGRHLVAASDSVGAALGGAEGGYFGDVVGGDGDYYELCDVVASLNVLGGVSGVMQADFDGAAISAIYDAGAVTEHQVAFDTGGAAHEHHAHMPTGHSNVYASVSYPVGVNRHCQVVG